MQNPGSGLEDHPNGTGNINAIVNFNWSVFESWLNPAEPVTVRWDNGTPGVTGTALTFSAAVLETGSDWVGAFVFFKTDGVTATIQSVSSTTVAVATSSGNVAAQYAIVYRDTATKYTALARGLMKMPQIGATHDAKIPAWSNSLQKFVFVTRPGFGFASGRIPFGNGAGNDLTSSADLTWDDATKVLTVGGQAKFENTVAEDVETDATFTGSETPDFALGNIFNFTLTGPATINNPSNVKEGAVYKLIFRQDATGGRTLAWGANFKFPDGVNSVDLTANAITIFYAVAVSTSELICFGRHATMIPTYKNAKIIQSTLTYSATTDISFDGDGVRTVSLTGNITFTTSNRGANKTVTVRIVCDGTGRTFAFPGWKFVGGAAPASIAASKTAILTLLCFGANDSDVVASYNVEP